MTTNRVQVECVRHHVPLMGPECHEGCVDVTTEWNLRQASLDLHPDCDPSVPVGQRVSGLLTEARTVLNRARTALEVAEECPEWHDHWAWVFDANGRKGQQVATGQHADPDLAMLRADLARVVEILAPYERTTKKRRKPTTGKIVDAANGELQK